MKKKNTLILSKKKKKKLNEAYDKSGTKQWLKKNQKFIAGVHTSLLGLMFIAGV